MFPGSELTLRGEPLRVKRTTEQIVVFDRLNPPPPTKRWVPEPKIYIITVGRVEELFASGALAPTAVSALQQVGYREPLGAPPHGNTDQT